MKLRNITAALALSATLLPQAATALSCLRPDVARSFTEVAAASESYIVVYGVFSFTPFETNPQGTPAINARFAGQSLTLDGFTHPTELNVSIQATCLSV